MSEKTDIDQIIQSDSSGKLFINAPDFFNQPKIQQMISSIMESNVFKKIVKEKHKK
ncbi:hypothetical protein [Pedobacter sp. SYP-B3415]|uniref:hypothetical protein n=1 Tax=Pedobacter sp. SYP-B3415 TaxID=2496641 RepID=UPI001981E62B|nr:hypothetical protein [Pedobacter sp. SYP-B3415]